MNEHNPDIGQKMRDIAQQLLSYEAAADDNCTDVSAAWCVLEGLRRPLCTLVGVQGFRVLLVRALTLGKSKAPGLSAVTVGPDGSLAGFNEVNGDEVSTAALVVIAELLALLSTFIGESLTLHILKSAWPDFTILNISSSGEN